ncbi:MAG TPA: N-acetyl sugar amidotransferase [Lacunisphaera sp.]|nr:N-acetyl sugar amidotransferase [Lacunisphaera sp.]
MSPRVCQRCLYTEAHPFGLVLDRHGICTGCRTHEEKTRLDWEERFSLLRAQLPALLGRRARRDYDCVVPVRGTPEYFKVLEIVKHELGLNPLVVAYNSQFNSAAGIENLDRLRDTFDVDLLHYTSNPAIYRKLVRESLARMRSMRWPFLAGETQFPVRVAADKGIPLVVWPYHQPTEQAGTHSYTETPEMSRRGRHCYDLMGSEPADLLATESLLRATDVEDLAYPSNPELRKHGIRGIYLANYLPWDSRRYSEEMVDRHGARCAANRRTFDTYDRIDDCTYMTVHDLLKQAKWGYARVTDNLCREIRFGRIGRDDAMAIARHYQAEFPREEVAQFNAWLGLRDGGFDWLLGKLSPAEVPPAPALTAAQETFVRSFRTNTSPVWETAEYIVFGKGIAVDTVA